MAKQTEQPKLVTRKHIVRQEKEQRQIRTIIIVGGTILLAVLALVVYSLVNQLYVKPNRAVANVGDQKISAREFEAEVRYSRLTTLNQAASYAQYGQMFGAMGGNFMSTAKNLIDQLNNPTNYGKTVLDRMIDDKLIQEEADKLGIKVSDEELKLELQKVFNFFPDGTLTPSVTPTFVATSTLSETQLAIIKPTETLKPASTLDPTQVASTETVVSGLQTATAQAQPTEPVAEGTPTSAAPTPVPSTTPTPTVYTTQVYAKAVKDYGTMLNTYDLTSIDMEKLVHSQMLRDKVLAEITKDMKPEQEQVWVRHIIVATEEEAKKALNEIKAGADFAEVAKTYSIDGTKDNGGDLGWMGLEDQNWDKDFLKAAFTLTQVGEISAPIQSQFGYHLIQLVGRSVNPVDETKFEEMKYVKFSNWLQEVKAQRSDITIEPTWAEVVPNIPAVPTQLQSVIEAGLTSQ